MRQKNNLRRLNAIGKIFDLEKFYCITLSEDVQLQGAFDRNIALIAFENGFESRINPLGYVLLNRPHYQITLT